MVESAVGAPVVLIEEVDKSRDSSIADMVVEEGILVGPGEGPLLGDVLVVAEGYPGWLSMIDPRRCASLSCWCPSRFKAVEGWPDGIAWLASCADVRRFFSGGEGSRTVLIQSSRGKVNGVDVIHLIDNEGLARAGDTIISVLRKANGKLSSTLSWNRVRHAAVGGVTSTSYLVGIVSPSIGPDVIRERLIPRTQVRRVIRGLAKVNERGFPVVPGKDLSTLDGSSAVKVEALLGWFVLPCELVPDKLVRRKLTVSEALTCCDVSVGMIKPMERLLDGNTGDLSRDFVSQPPAKILQFAFDAVVKEQTQLNPLGEAGLSADPSSSELKLSTFDPNVILGQIEAAHVSAVKNDDAVTDTSLWDHAVTEDFSASKHGKLFTFLRTRLTRRFAHNAWRSFKRYLRGKYPDQDLTVPTDELGDEEREKDLAAGNDAILRARRATFWSWDDGSTPFFWRWQPEIHKEVRDGSPLFVHWDLLPSFKRKQTMPKDPSTFDMVLDKISKVRSRRYIAAGLVLSLTSFFPVPKGDDDIRMVYDLTACGLNAALWAPSFWMPTITDVLDCATATSWFGDIDAGEMFLNYLLDERIRPYAGVDLSWLNPKGGSRWERWTRMAMGMRPSPFVTVRLFAWAMEFIQGDRHDPLNPFHWSKVILNCPGSPTYDPSMPKVYKWNPVALAIACDCKTFVDDSRSIGPTRELVTQATHQMETRMAYLGLQDATRKRRPISRTPGEWTGSISVAIPDVGLFVTVSQKKWDKAKSILTDLAKQFETSGPCPLLNLKDLEKKVGFLVHLGMAYPLMLPFLRGFYLTMNSWRKDRDSEGWKLGKVAFEAMISQMRKNGSWDPASGGEQDAPLEVQAVPVLEEHLKALLVLFEGHKPTLRLIRGASIYEVCYVFGDASGEGFGSSHLRSDGSIGFRFGIWGSEGAGTTSNYRELRNLVETLEAMGRRDELKGKEVFIFTDNSVSESIAAKGSSSSPLLFELVVRLYKLEMQFLCRIQVVHVAGTRMIAQGTDGLSRGDMFEGVMKGASMLSFVPLHKTAIERSPKLLDWVSGWCEVADFGSLEVLDEDGWFERGHDIDGSRLNPDGMWLPGYRSGNFVWAPPPAAGRFAVSELRQARLKRQASFHVVLIPKLMQAEWRRQLYKGADLIFDLPVGHEVWPSAMHESLTVALFFPYLNRAPWEFKKTRLMVDMGRLLPKVFKEAPALAGAVLSELCSLTRRLDTMPLGDVRRVLYGGWKPRVSGEQSFQ